MPSFTEEELNLISTCNYESRTGLIEELECLTGSLGPEEKHLGFLISGVIQKLEKMTREEYRTFCTRVIPEKKGLRHFDLGL